MPDARVATASRSIRAALARVVPRDVVHAYRRRRALRRYLSQLGVEVYDRRMRVDPASLESRLAERRAGHDAEVAGQAVDRMIPVVLELDRRIEALRREVEGLRTGPGQARIAGSADGAGAVPRAEELRPAVERLTAETLAPAGAGVALDLAYRLLLRRPVEEPALRAALLSLSAGQATRADLLRWIVESPEFAEIEFIEKALSDLRLHPGTTFTLAPGHPAAPGATERAVEIPWVLSRWAGEERVLDLGYAYAGGTYLSALVGLGVRSLHGVDWSAAPVPGMHRTRGDLRALPYRDGSFDLVLCISTIEHVGLDNSRYGIERADGRSGDAQALAEVERVLRPGGRLLITVPFGQTMDESWFVQYDGARWGRLVSSTSLVEEEREVFHLTDAGWARTDDLRSAERLVYGVGAPAARAVLCAVLRAPSRG